MAQTSYSLDHTIASSGMLHELQSPVSKTVLAVETAAGVGAGVAVSYGTAANGCVIGGTDFAGITFRDSSPGAVSGNAFIYAQTDLAEVLEIGRVWCTVSGSVAIGNSVAYNATTGVLTAGPAGAGERNIIGARFETAAADGGVARVRLVNMTTTAGS